MSTENPQDAVDSVPDPSRKLDELFRVIDAGGVVYFPIRHHSPACARQLGALIEGTEPVSVLVEGPQDFDALIPLLLHERTRPPVAVYTTYVDTARRVFKPSSRAADAPRGPDAGLPARFAAYYPLCDYSPELVALKAGQACGAHLRFIDLNYPEKIVAGRAEMEQDHKPRVQSLFEETHLRQSEYLQALAQRSGCRDADDLWDHLFETRHQATPTPDFIRQVAAYCLMARLDHADEVLEADGTLAREQAMAAAIRDELESNADEGRTGTVIVVTGGFHTVVLPHLVAAPDVRRPPRLKLTDDESVTSLMRYSFDQLDALNGYSAGMPSPHYYQRLWQLLDEEHGDPFGETAGRVIVDVGRLTRSRKLPFALSTADEIAAVEQARRLAALRGRPGPAREDLLDALRSCFVKGAMDGEGSLVMDVVRHVLAGDQVGEVPPEAGVPPLVTDFRTTCGRLRLTITDTVRRKLSLDIYRKTPHRRSSRFLHCLTYLGSPFARLTGGPDFARGTGLGLLHEHWEYAWSPNAESALIEASVYGSTVPEAALARLREAMAELEDEGRSRSTAEAVRLLTTACRMGLHRHVDDLLDLIESNIAEDPQLTSLATGLKELHLLWQSREPLEAHDLEAIPRLVQIAYRRACFLLPDLATAGEDEVETTLPVLGTLHELSAAPSSDTDASSDADSPTLDAGLLAGALESLIWGRPMTGPWVETQGWTRSSLPDAEGDTDGDAATTSTPSTTTPPAIIGGAAGILFSSGRIEETRLLELFVGHLTGTASDPVARSGFLRGLLATCREVLWRLPGLLSALDELLAGWDDGGFVRALPTLRLAFSALTPREVDRLSATIGGLHGRADLGQLVHASVDEKEVLFNLEVGRLVQESLDHDQLSAWAKGTLDR